MVDIHSATAEIRLGKKEERRRKNKKPQAKNMMSASTTEGDHNKPNYFEHTCVYMLSMFYL